MSIIKSIMIRYIIEFVRECLREISPEQLERVLNIPENISEAQMRVSYIDIYLFILSNII